jgi:hypothetical protein
MGYSYKNVKKNTTEMKKEENKFIRRLYAEAVL